MRCFRLVVIALVFGMAGCSSEKKLAPVSGKVTIDGKPVTAGMVTFVAADMSNSASGEITPDGTYQIADAPTGEVLIAVRTKDHAVILRPGPGKMIDNPVGGSAIYAPSQVKNPLYVATPERYEDVTQSGLKLSIPKSGRKPFVHDIELTE